MSEPADSPQPPESEDAEARPAAEQAPTAAAGPQQAPEPTPAAAAPAQHAGPPQAAQHAAPPQSAPAQHPRQPQPRPQYLGPNPPPQRFVPPNPRWHRPALSASQTTVLLVAAVALFGGWAAFHDDGVGIGLALTGIGMTVVPLLSLGRDELRRHLPGAVLVAALWSVAAIRDAGWVVALCALAAFALTPLVFAPQRRFTGTVVTLCFGWLEGLAAAFGWAKRGRRGGESNNALRNLRVVLVTAGLLIVFGGLFAAADSNFARLLAQLLPSMNPVEIFLRLLLAALIFPTLLLWAYTAVAKPSFDPEIEREHRTVSRFEIAVPLGALNLLFAAFIAMQVRVYFGGKDYVMETAGLTFADYARQGFWQLTAVAVLSLVVVAFAAWLAPKHEKADRWTVRALLAALCAMSMIVIASATFRMAVYFDAYGLTRLRVWVFTVEIWLAILFALVLVCCWKLRATWLPQAVLGSGAMVLLGLAAANPDALIARYNLQDDRDVDLTYLSTLSADAAPEFAELPEEDRDCVLWRESGEREALAWNLGYQRALEFQTDAGSGSSNCLVISTDSYRYGSE